MIEHWQASIAEYHFNRQWDNDGFSPTDLQTSETIFATAALLWFLLRWRETARYVCEISDDPDIRRAGDRQWIFSWLRMCEWRSAVSLESLVSNDPAVRRINQQVPRVKRLVVDDLTAVEAGLNYLAPAGKRPRTYAVEPPAHEPRTVNVAFEVPVRDGRPAPDQSRGRERLPSSLPSCPSATAGSAARGAYATSAWCTW